MEEPERPTLSGLSTYVQTISEPRTSDGETPRLYLHVVDGDSSSMVPLTRDQQVTIGRVPGNDIVLRDQSVSRHHARIELADGVATLVDQESQNGSLVNNRRVSRQVITHGDVITIGNAIIVFHGPGGASGVRTVVDVGELHDHLQREIERIIHFGRELGVVCIEPGGADRAAVERAVRPLVRTLDLGAWAPDGALLLLLPELGAEAIGAVVARILGAIPEVRAGVACAPRDGCDADGLLGGARGAAQRARWGESASATGALMELALGDQTAVIADPGMARVYSVVERLAVADMPVLVNGETGAGKELVAAALHHLSSRRDKPRVALNCAALPENLVESELFGHERGAFSGAVAAKPGIFELASGGTVFLDEVGELSAIVQAKLLRVLETKRVVRVGGVREIAIDVRVVSATNRDLKEEVRANRFRQDLYFRLSGATVWLPPLRDRPREIPILARRFLAEACARAGHATLELTSGAMSKLATYAWPGNVRELRNVCEYLAATVGDVAIDELHVEEVLRVAPGAVDPPPQPNPPPMPEPEAEPAATDPTFRPLGDELEELERARITEALRVARGNQTRAAKLISVPLRTFLTKLKRYGIEP